MPDTKDLVNTILSEAQLGLSPEDASVMITEAIEKRMTVYREKEVKEDV